MRICVKAAAWVTAAAVALTFSPSTAVAQVRFFDRDSALRFQVTPENAEVFLDGYIVGTVDDFNGIFQRLHLAPGEHDIELYLSGYRSVHQKILVQPGATFRVRYTMEALKPGDTPDPRPVAPPPPPLPPPPPFGERRPGAPPRASGRSEFGAIAIRVQPRDATVLIDGERWDAPADNDRLVVQVPAGEHRVEIRKEGFGSYTSTVDVRRGDETTLNVSLTRE
jgi:hypothetical protein